VLVKLVRLSLVFIKGNLTWYDTYSILLYPGIVSKHSSTASGRVESGHRSKMLTRFQLLRQCLPVIWRKKLLSNITKDRGIAYRSSISKPRLSTAEHWNWALAVTNDWAFVGRCSLFTGQSFYSSGFWSVATVPTVWPQRYRLPYTWFRRVQRAPSCPAKSAILLTLLCLSV